MAKILLIDDINDNLIALKALISELFPEITTYSACSGPEGIELAKIHDPDIILLDFLMPGIDGFSTCKIIKADNLLKDIPVVFVTEPNETRENKIKALESGAEGFLTKPVEETELTVQINAMLKISASNKEKLKEKDELLRKITENMTDVLWTTDLGLHITYVSPSIKKLLGFTPDEYIKRSVYKRFSHSEIVKVTSLLKEELDNEKLPGINKDRNRIVEFREYNSNGELVEISVNLKFLRDENGNVNGIIGLSRDITEKQKIQKELNESQRQLSTLMGNLPGIAYRCAYDKDWTMEYISQGCIDLTGYRPEDFIQNKKLSFNDIILPEYKNYLYNKWTEILHEREIFREEFQIKTKDGKLKWVWEQGCGIYNEKGEVVALEGFITDITERKTAEQEYAHSEMRFKTLFEDLPTATYMFDKDGQIHLWNKACENLHGWTKEQAVGKTIFELMVLPENAERAKKNIASVFNGKSGSNLEFEDVGADGKKRFVLLNEYPLRDASGEVAFGLCAQIDITDRKTTEKKLLASEKRFRTMFEELPAASFTFDREARIQLWNKACENLYGWTSEQAIGKTMFELMVQEKNAEITRKNIEKIFNNQSLYNLEFEDTSTDGSKRYVIAHEYPVSDSKGDVKFGLCSQIDITDRKKAEEKLIEAANNWTKTFDAIKDGIMLLDEKQNIVACNSSTLKILNKTREELIGHKCFAKVHNTTCRIEKCPFHAMLNSNIRESIEYNIGNRTYEIIVDPIHDSQLNITGAVHILSDITEQKKVREEIQKERKLLRTLIDNLPSTIYFKDVQGRKMIANTSDIEVIGLNSEEESIGKTDLELFPGEIGERGFADDMQIIESGNPVINREDQFFASDGTEKWLLTSKLPIYDLNGKINGLVGIGHNITELKAVTEELKQAKEKAEESDRLKSAFLANMSHEIRTPMNGILGFVELLKSPELDEKERLYFIDVVNKSGERLLNTINDIIELSRIEAGDIPVLNEEIKLGDFLLYYYKFFLPEATKKRLKLKLLKNDSLPVTIVADKNKVHSILTNLVKNAIKFTEKGTIEFGCDQEDSHLRFFVKDTGRGIKKERHGAIFDRFVQEEVGFSRGYEGSGLGLSISNAYVQALGGKIWVESEPGKGSCFYFTIPVIQAGHQTTPSIGAQMALEMEEGKTRVLKILIVEDDDVSYLFLDVIFKTKKHKYARATNGMEAVEFCKNNPDTDLVIMDIKMPVMDGYQATRKIREFNTGVYIIAQTAFAMPSDELNSKEAGCNAFISKPVRVEKLFELINDYLKE